MKTRAFWETVKQVSDITINSCVVADSQGHDTNQYEREQIQHLLKKCNNQLSVLENEVALNRGNGLKPSDISCEEISHTTQRTCEEPEKL